MNIVISAGGRFHALQLAHQLTKQNALSHLFTFSYTGNDQRLISSSNVSNITQCSVLDTLFLKCRLDRIIHKSSYNVFKDNLFDRVVSKKISNVGQFDLFIGWAHYALRSIPAARKAGAKIIIESGSCHILEQQQLLAQEYATFNVHSTPIHKNNSEKMLQEYEYADYIMTPSHFAYNSFIKHGIPPHKMLRVPYGVDASFFTDAPTSTYLPKKFRVIFVGLVGLRKGIQYLLQAWNILKLPEKETELLIVGFVQQEITALIKTMRLPSNVIFYGPTNRTILKNLYHESNIFVLPSIEEGLSMVIGEAMASGLPVICTTNTGGTDIVNDQEHGFILPIRNAHTLAEKILWCYENQEHSKLMGAAGQEHIKKFTWDVYGQKVYEIYKSIV